MEQKLVDNPPLQKFVNQKCKNTISGFLPVFTIAVRCQQPRLLLVQIGKLGDCWHFQHLYALRWKGGRDEERGHQNNDGLLRVV